MINWMNFLRQYLLNYFMVDIKFKDPIFLLVNLILFHLAVILINNHFISMYIVLLLYHDFEIH